LGRKGGGRISRGRYQDDFSARVLVKWVKKWVGAEKNGVGGIFFGGIIFLWFFNFLKLFFFIK
jgi:hypothetical protein